MLIFRVQVSVVMDTTLNSFTPHFEDVILTVGKGYSFKGGRGFENSNYSNHKERGEEK